MNLVSVCQEIVYDMNYNLLGIESTCADNVIDDVYVYVECQCALGGCSTIWNEIDIENDDETYQS